METLLESLGPIILAFIVLVYYGLRAMFKPRRHHGEATSEDDYFLADPIETERTQNRSYFESSGFVFSDPISDDPAKTQPQPSDRAKKQPPATTETSQTTTQSPPAGKNRIFTSLFPTASDLIADRVEKLYSTSNEIANKPQKPSPPSPKPYSTSVSHESDRTLHVKPPVPKQKRSNPTTLSVLPAQRRLSLRNELKMKLSHPTLRQQTLKETLFLNEIINKPLALRNQNERQHF